MNHIKQQNISFYDLYLLILLIKSFLSIFKPTFRAITTFTYIIMIKKVFNIISIFIVEAKIFKASKEHSIYKQLKL